MYRLFVVMTNKYCKDSLTDLMNMSFADFSQLEMMLRIRSMYDEEVEFNKLSIQKA